MRTIARIRFMAARRYGFPVLVAAMLGPLILGVAAPAPPQTAPAMVERRYDIAAQPVARAIAEFATVSGVSVIYRQSVAGERLSTQLNGVYSAPAALRRLLAGTGLAARFTGPNSAIIFVEGQAPAADSAASAATTGLSALHLDMAEVRAPRMVGRRDPSAFNRYAQRVRTEIFERLKRDGAYEGRRFRLEIAVTVDSRGQISAVEFLRRSDEPEWDARVRYVLTGAQLSSAPPEGLSRSMRFEVETDRLAERSDARSGRRRP